MAVVAFTGPAPANRNSQTQDLFTPGQDLDMPSQSSAWSLKTVLIRLAVLIFVAPPLLLVAGTVMMMIGSIMGGGIGALTGGVMGALAGLAALFLGSRG
jgi:hypothetical protein